MCLRSLSTACEHCPSALRRPFLCSPPWASPPGTCTFMTRAESASGLHPEARSQGALMPCASCSKIQHPVTVCQYRLRGEWSRAELRSSPPTPRCFPSSGSWHRTQQQLPALACQGFHVPSGLVSQREAHHALGRCVLPLKLQSAGGCPLWVAVASQWEGESWLLS